MMKTMFKQMKIYLSIAVFALVGTLTVGCNSMEDDSVIASDIAGSRTVTLETTLSFDGTQTRALTEQGVKTFAEGDKIAVIYWRKDDTDYLEKVETAALQANDIKDGGKTAKIAVTLINPREGESNVTFVYPASLASRDFADGINMDSLCACQDGTFANIAQWDAATAAGQVTVSGQTATLSSGVSLKNSFCIVGFNFKDSNAASLNSQITDVDVTAGNYNYNIKRTASAERIYLAMKPVENRKVTITFKDGNDYYSQSVTTTLGANKIYPINATLTKINPSEIPLTIKAAADGTIRFSLWANMYSGKEVKYTKNGEYVGLIYNGYSTDIPVSAGDEICFYGNNSTYYQVDGNGHDRYSNISCGVTPCFVYGNIMSLVNGMKKYSEDPNESITNDFATATELADVWNTFHSLFRGNDFLLSHSLPLVLPATTLTDACYKNMFTDCYRLTKAPELPATALKPSCYAEMFYGCRSLIKAPSEIPATEMQTESCRMMFSDCRNLSSAPILRATTMAQSCYRYMFSGCTKLTKAPDLIAPTLATECYIGMFRTCTNLSYVKCLATSGLTQANTDGWLYQVSSTGTFVKASDADVSGGAIPSGWSIVDQ